jgi:hypothetical protein
VVTHTHPILLVEPTGETPVERMLGNDGWQVIRAGAAADAMERAKHDQPSAVVFRGAVADAVDLAKKLRCNARTALLPMAIVADASDGAREELARWGVASVLPSTVPTASSPTPYGNSRRFRRRPRHPTPNWDARTA